MKTFCYTLLLAILLLTTAACDSGGSGDASAECLSRTGNMMSAEIDGQAICTDIGSAINAGLTGPGITILALFNTSTPSGSMLLNVDNIAVGTFDLANGDDGTDGLYVDNATEIGCSVGHGEGSGTITISALSDTRVSGTFAFTAICYDANSRRTGEQVRVTDGTFDIALSNIF